MSKQEGIPDIQKDAVETIEEVEKIVKDKTITCYTKIALFFKKLVYCECNSSSNCVKKL
jgi:hypothetical protein